MDVGRLGVDTLEGIAALTLLFPGAVIDPREASDPNRFGVAGVCRGVPSLVDGRRLLPSAEAGRAGGGMEVSPLKKLDLRLPLPPAGDWGSCDRLSIVRSDNDGRDFRGAGFEGGS